MFNFGKMGSMMKNLSKMQGLMKDENFKAFLEHPEVKSLMMDQDFQKAVQSKNYMKLMSNPKLHKIMNDPAVKDALSKLNLDNLK